MTKRAQRISSTLEFSRRREGDEERSPRGESISARRIVGPSLSTQQYQARREQQERGPKVLLIVNLIIEV